MTDKEFISRWDSDRQFDTEELEAICQQVGRDIYCQRSWLGDHLLAIRTFRVGGRFFRIDYLVDDFSDTIDCTDSVVTEIGG